MALTRIRAQQISDIDYKQAVRVITVANVTLSGGAPNAVDGVNLAANDRILVAGQGTGSQNGLYYVQTLGTGSNGTWVRTADGNETGEIQSGMIVMVTEGDVYKDTQWKLTTNDPITIGVTNLVFEQNSAYAFGNIYANGTAILAGSVGGPVIFAAGNNIAITGNNTTKTITFDVTGISTANISNGTSNVAINSSGGNVTVGVNGTGNVAVFASTGGYITGVLSASGNVTGGNITTAGSVTATGNLIAGNLLTSGLVSATGNGTFGNISGTNVTGTTISASGNVIGGNITTAGIMSSTGNAIHGNILTGGLISATGNICGGNLLTGGLISATSSITSANGITATANVTGGNITTAGIMSSTGNAIHGNVLTSGLISATGSITSAAGITATANISAGNILTSGLMSTTANITGGNLLTAGLITATGNITGGNLITGGLLSTVGNLYVGVGNAGYVYGNAFYMTGISSAISVTKIENGNSNVWVRDPGGDVTITAGGVSNVAIFSTGSLAVSGAIGNPKSMTGNVVLANGINATMIGPIDFGTYNLTVPSNSTLYVIPG